ncbi:MAG: Arginine-tRNA ligase [Parcubacteria group bacterium GW2011_GWB1_43_6]|nr:MAG: Arginine-tRNA ligase [Parcubacteria group bacterium GW2011_GWB1_43_6]
MIRQEIIKLIQKATGESPEKIRVAYPEGEGFGDYTTNIALQLEVAGPGFINFFLAKGYLQKQVGIILKEKESFGELKIGRGQKVNVEFISANPTGPLTLGNGRGGFCGDVLTNVLNAAGYQAKREYYINDTGEQIKKLGHSVIGDAEAVYQGRYIEELKKKIKGNNPEKIGQSAAKIILQEMIKPTIKKMKIKFDVWFSEKTLYQKKEVDRILDVLKKKKLSYGKEGALWFKSTQFGDDKDRVLIKAGGEETYLASDIAYLKNKFVRGFQKLIFFWGADHYGYVARILAAAEALGYKKEQIDIIVMQLVRLIRDGKEVRMSKRTGTYVTLDELIDEVGLDVARCFFLTRSADTHLNFDLALAKTQSEKNPVYYIQYAHARICSILRKVKMSKARPRTDLLEHPAELKLIRQLMRLPEIVEDTSQDFQIQRLPQYAVDLATVFHQFYRDCHVISEDKNLSQARLSLVLAAKIVLKNTLSLMGISAPEKM